MYRKVIHDAWQRFKRISKLSSNVYLVNKIEHLPEKKYHKREVYVSNVNDFNIWKITWNEEKGIDTLRMIGDGIYLRSGLDIKFVSYHRGFVKLHKILYIIYSSTIYKVEVWMFLETGVLLVC